MARKLRVQYPGAIYHVMNRGDRREPIFSDDKDREMFLDTLGQTCERTDWLVHAWCLMANHFSSGRRNTGSQSGGRHEMVFGDLHLPLQSAAQVFWSPL